MNLTKINQHLLDDARVEEAMIDAVVEKVPGATHMNTAITGWGVEEAGIIGVGFDTCAEDGSDLEGRMILTPEQFSAYVSEVSDARAARAYYECFGVDLLA